jgi:Glutathione S-transferase, N-terminal domain
VKLYVCYGTFPTPRPGGHPCGNAHEALRKAGWDPQVVKSYGGGFLPDFLNPFQGRREVKELTGNSWVPVLVTDDGEVVQDSKRIVEWAEANPAPPAYKKP